MVIDGKAFSAVKSINIAEYLKYPHNITNLVNPNILVKIMHLHYSPHIAKYHQLYAEIGGANISELPEPSPFNIRLYLKKYLREVDVLFITYFSVMNISFKNNLRKQMDYFNRIMPGGLPEDFIFTSELEEGVLHRIKVTDNDIEVCSNISDEDDAEDYVWEKLIINIQPDDPKEKKRMKSSSAQDSKDPTNQPVLYKDKEKSTSLSSTNKEYAVHFEKTDKLFAVMNSKAQHQTFRSGGNKRKQDSIVAGVLPTTDKTSDIAQTTNKVAKSTTVCTAVTQNINNVTAQTTNKVAQGTTAATAVTLPDYSDSDEGDGKSVADSADDGKSDDGEDGEDDDDEPKNEHGNIDHGHTMVPKNSVQTNHLAMPATYTVKGGELKFMLRPKVDQDVWNKSGGDPMKFVKLIEKKFHDDYTAFALNNQLHSKYVEYILQIACRVPISAVTVVKSSMPPISEPRNSYLTKITNFVPRLEHVTSIITLLIENGGCDKEALLEMKAVWGTMFTEIGAGNSSATTVPFELVNTLTAKGWVRHAGKASGKSESTKLESWSSGESEAVTRLAGVSSLIYNPKTSFSSLSSSTATVISSQVTTAQEFKVLHGPFNEKELSDVGTPGMKLSRQHYRNLSTDTHDTCAANFVASIHYSTFIRDETTALKVLESLFTHDERYYYMLYENSQLLLARWMTYLASEWINQVKETGSTATQSEDVHNIKTIQESYKSDPMATLQWPHVVVDMYTYCKVVTGQLDGQGTRLLTLLIERHNETGHAAMFDKFATLLQSTYEGGHLITSLTEHRRAQVTLNSNAARIKITSATGSCSKDVIVPGSSSEVAHVLYSDTCVVNKFISMIDAYIEKGSSSENVSDNNLKIIRNKVTDQIGCGELKTPEDVIARISKLLETIVFVPRQLTPAPSAMVVQVKGEVKSKNPNLSARLEQSRVVVRKHFDNHSSGTTTHKGAFVNYKGDLLLKVAPDSNNSYVWQFSHSEWLALPKEVKAALTIIKRASLVAYNFDKNVDPIVIGSKTREVVRTGNATDKTAFISKPGGGKKLQKLKHKPVDSETKAISKTLALLAEGQKTQKSVLDSLIAGSASASSSATVAGSGGDTGKRSAST